MPSLPAGDLPNPGIEPKSPALQADSSLTELPGNPKNTGAGSLSLLQGIFLTQETNWGLLHCMQILYQLSYQGSPQVMPDLLNSPWDGKGKPRLPVYRGSGSSFEKQNLKVQGLQFGKQPNNSFNHAQSYSGLCFSVLLFSFSCKQRN